MNWDAIGAIGQMLGSLAVFITLGYLAVQLKHARQDSRRALSQSRGDALRDLYAKQGDERMTRLSTKAGVALGVQPTAVVSALMEQAGLTRDEATEVFWMQLAWWQYRTQMIPNVNELHPIDRDSFDGAIRGVYRVPGVARLFYETMKSRTHPDAVRYIDNLLAQPG